MHRTDRIRTLLVSSSGLIAIRRFLLEAERACDDAVLAYAEPVPGEFQITLK